MSAHSLIVIWVGVCTILLVIFIDGAKKDIIDEIRKLRK